MDEGIPDLPQGRVQKAVAYFGVPSVQAEAKEDLRILQPKMDKDHGYSGAHRRETEANAQ